MTKQELQNLALEDEDAALCGCGIECPLCPQCQEHQEKMQALSIEDYEAFIAFTTL